MTEIEGECIRRIAEAKGIAAAPITRDTTLDELEVDSLDRVSLSFDLEEQYGVNIPEAKLQAIRTVGDVADAVEEALRTKAAASGANPNTGAA